MTNPPYPLVSTDWLETHHTPYAIHVPGNQMSAETIHQAQRFFQIDLGALLKPARAAQGFRRYIHRKTIGR